MNRANYSINSSARASSVGEMVMQSAFAVLRLMTSSNFVGCSTGKSAGLAQRAQTDYAGGKSRPFGSEIQITVCASAEWRDRWPLPCVSSTNTKLPA